MTNGSKVDALKELSKYIKDGIIDDAIYQAYVDAAKAYGATQKEIEDAIQSGKKAIETAQKTSHEAVQVAKNAEKIATQSAELISSVNKTQSIVEEKLAKLSRRVKREQENLNRKIIRGPVFEAVPSQYSKEAYEKEHKYVHTGKTKYKTKQIIPGSEVDLNKIRKMSVTQIAGVLTGNKFGDYSEEAIKAMETELKAMKGKELTGEYLDLKNKIVSAKNAAKQIGDAARRGTAFHKIAELLESGNLAIEQLTEAKIKSLAEDYSEIQEGIDGETEKDINYNVKRLKAMASDYEKLKKQAGLQGKPTTEKSLGFLAQIGDEIVEITGTFDSFFSQLGTLLDFKTTATIDPKKIGVQLNLLKKAIELHGGDVSSLQALHIPFRMGGRAVTSESSVYNVGTVDDVVMQDWIEKAFKGVAAEVPTLLKSVLEPYSWTKGKQTKSSWMLNKIPISKFPSMIKQGRLDEIVGMVQGLSPEEQKHFLNLIWSTKEYGEGKPVGGVESDKLYRRGREWDKLRRALPSFYTGLKTATGISEETFIDEEGNVSGATTVGGGFLSQWSKAYRLKLAEGGEKAAQTVVDQFVKIIKDSTDEIGRDEIFGKLSSLSFKDDIHDSFIDAVDKSLFGEGGSSFYSGNNAERVSELKTEVETLVKKQEEISKSAAEQGNVYTDEQLKEYRLLSERIESLNTEIEKLSYGYSKEPTGAEQVGINERSKEENAARAIRSQKRAGERYYREQGVLMRRLSQFEEGASQLDAKTPEQVLGFVKGIGSLKSIFQGALNELDGEGLSQLNEAGMPEFIENSEYLLDRWYQFVRTIKEKISPIAQDMVDVARQTGDWSRVNALNSTLNNLTLTEDTSSLATKAAQKFSWLYQAKDIYDEMLSEEEPVKSGTLSVEEWAAQRLTPEQYGQYADSMRVKEIVSKSGGNFENFITDFLKISYDTMNSELTKRVRDAVEKIKNETPELLTGKFLDIILKQTDIAGGESAKMQWWHEHSALEYLKRGETIGVFPEEKKYEDAGKAIVALEEKIERLNDAIAETTERYEGLSEGLSVNEKLFAEEYKTKNKLEGSTDPKSIIKKFDELIGIDAYLEKRKQLLDFAKTHNIKVDKDFLSGNAEGPWMARLRDDGSERVRKYNEQQDKNWDEYIRIVDEFTEANDAIKAAAKAGGMARLLTLRKELIKDEETVRRAQMGIDTSKTGKVKEIINTLSQTVEGLRMLKPASEEKIQTAQVETPKADVNADTVIIGEPESPTVAEAEPPTTESVPVKKKTTRKRKTTKKSSRKNDGVDVVPDGGGIGGDGIPPQLDGSEILDELKGIHKDTSSIDSKLQSGVVLSDDDGRATSQTTSRATSIKPTDKVKKYLEYSKTISDLRVKQQKEESSLGKNKYEVMIEAYQKLQKDLGDFTDDEKLLIQEKEKEIEQNQQLKLSEVEIAAAKKQTKQEAKDAAQVEKDRVKSEKDAATQTAKTAKEYQRYLDQRFSILSKIESAQAQYNISTGKEKIAAEGVVAQRKIELDYLDQKNSDLIETMATTQKSTKLDMDYAQSLRVASMQQEKLLGKKGAASIWDVMANDIKRATMRVADFGIAAKVMNKIPQDIQKVIQYTKELDAAMTNIRIVGGYNEEQAKSLMRSYTELGKTLGATTVEVATAANEWLRQGYEAEDQLKELISASTKLSKLGMISASEATTALTSALKSFNLTAEDAIDVVDKLTKVDQLAAVSAGGIATALQKSATSAKLAGMSMDELIGSVSVIGEVTQQSMDTVGHAMKSILARYGNVKASVFTQMGLNDDGETTENINDIEKVLSKLGIRMRSSSTELRDITDVLDEVNEKWDTYDTVTKNALATAFGGTRMRENFLVLMENWDRVKELTEESANAAGTADEKYSAYMDSMEAATKRLQNAWEGFTQSLATSTIMKTLTNAVAFLVENADKLKYVITYITAVSSSKIFDFFTNKGETGGFKGLIANIPFLGRGTKTNNILESIDRKVGDIRGEVKKDKTTKNGGFFGRWITGIAQYKQDKQRIEKDVIQAATMAASKEAYLSQAQKVNILRLQSEAMGGPLADFDEMQEAQAISQQYEEEKKILQEKRQQYKAQEAISKANAEEVEISKERIAKQKQSRLTAFKQTAIVSGLITALTQLSTDKTIGSGVSGWIGKQLTGIGDNEQVMSETAAGKAARVGLSTAGAVAGATTALIPVIGPMIAPIVSSVGSIAGEGLASIISTIVHRSELEMKQRVADAKENSKALTSINNSVSENSSLMKETFLDSSGVKNLSKYVDELSEKLGELSNDALSEFLSTVSTSTEKFKTISDLSNYILEANAEERKEIQQRIEVVTAKEQLKQTIASQEEERYKIAQAQNKQISPDYLNISYKDAAWSTPRYAPYFEALQKYTDLSDTTGISAGAHQAGDFSIKGRTAREQLSNLQSLIEEVRQSVDKANAEFSASYIKKLLKQLEDYEKELGDAVKAQDKLDAALIKSRVQVAFFQANLSDLTQSELQNLTIDGVAGKVVEALEKDGVAVRDLSGTIKDDYLTQIKLAIKSDEDLYSQLQTDTKSIGELMEVRSKFIQQFGEDYDEVREQLDKGKLDYLSDGLKGLIYSADPERIKQFAQAWHIATSEVENFAKRFPNLNTATGLMSVDEVKDKYTKIAEIFSDISQDRTLSIENFENILKNYPEYISKIGDYEGLMGSLISSIGEESAEAYKNALFTDVMSSANYLAEFKKTLSEEDVKTIEDAKAKSFEDIYQLAQGKEELKGITEALDEYLNKVIEVENESPLKDFMIELKSGLLDEEINNLNEQKDALSKINDERKKEIEYIKAKYALEDARKEKKRVFRAGVGWTYESDEAAISEAKEKVDSLDLERQQESLQYQIDSLEQQKEILEAIKNNEQLKKIEEALGANGISTDTADIAMMLAQSLKLDLGERTKDYKTALSEKAKGLEKNVDTALQAYQTALKKFTEGDENGQKWENWNQAVRKNKLENLSSLYSEYQKAYDAAQSFGVKNMERWSEDGKIIPNAAESDKYSIDRIVVNGLGRHFLDWFKDDIKLRVGDKEFAAELSNSNMTVTQKELNEAYGQSPAKGDVFSYGEKYYVYRGDEWWEVLKDKGGTKFYEYMTGTPANASGTTSFPGGQTLINELGTEAVITPGGTLTALPSKTGIVPADITRNVWALGEVAPTLIARLGSLTQKPLAGNGANTTYEEGQYIDNLTMNVYPAKGDDFNKILEQARAQVRLTRRNN